MRRPTARQGDGRRGLLAVGLLLLGAGCSPEPRPAAAPAAPPPLTGVSGARALEEALALIDIYPRHAGTPGAETAARHLAERLAAAGVPVAVETFTDPTPEGPMTFHNVVGRLPGAGSDIVILGSHFDTKVGMPEGFEGANDSGSSSGLLLELARGLADGPPLPFTVWFAFFDGEECRIRYGPRDGLHGSRHMVRQLTAQGLTDRVLAIIVLDMVGDPDLTLTIPRNCTPAWVQRVFRAAQAEDLRRYFRLLPTAILDDHVPFLEAGIPAVNLIDFEFGSAPGRNDYWHTAHDHRGHISAESLDKVGRVVVRLLRDWTPEAPP
ncbi:MAG: Zn-dependent exopeptidase M28 [Candidatus Marinimicrobia bacterium]|nr:Zn-dependent exopeptidase M28 [Candidatus Neomarinimicrobiota bacterium]